jgi:hypothetical protein
MDSSLDKYSKPVGEENTKLSTIFLLNSRDSKKGRLWIPIFNKEAPLKFDVKFAYLSRILEKNNVSGNHYHKLKEEIIIPLNGSFEIHLEEVETKEKEIVLVNSEENKAIYIGTGISHKVVSKDEAGLLLVLASTPSTIEDEIDYVVE